MGYPRVPPSLWMTELFAYHSWDNPLDKQYFTEIERRLSVTNLSSENNFADVLTECSSRHQGESDDDWSIQSKRGQSYFSELKLVTDNLLSIYAAAN